MKWIERNNCLPAISLVGWNVILRKSPRSKIMRITLRCLAVVLLFITIVYVFVDSQTLDAQLLIEKDELPYVNGSIEKVSQRDATTFNDNVQQKVSPTEAETTLPSNLRPAIMLLTGYRAGSTFVGELGSKI